MSTKERSALAAGVDALIADPDAEVLHKQMLGIIELLDRGIPARLAGRAAVLNPLVDLYATDPEAFERVIELVNRKRVESGLEELAEPAAPAGDDVSEGADRRAYMREFMAQKREKQALLVKLWNELRAEDSRLKGVRRMEFEREHAARWQDEKKRREEAARERLGRRLSEAERKQIATKLWEDVQSELDELGVFVREQIRKPLHMRAAMGFEFKVGKVKRPL